MMSRTIHIWHEMKVTRAPTLWPGVPKQRQPAMNTLSRHLHTEHPAHYSIQQVLCPCAPASRHQPRPWSHALSPRLGDALDLVHDGGDVDRVLHHRLPLAALPLEQLQHARVVLEQRGHGRLQHVLAARGRRKVRTHLGVHALHAVLPARGKVAQDGRGLRRREVGDGLPLGHRHALLLLLRLLDKLHQHGEVVHQLVLHVQLAALAQRLLAVPQRLGRHHVAALCGRGCAPWRGAARPRARPLREHRVRALQRRAYVRVVGDEEDDAHAPVPEQVAHAQQQVAQHRPQPAHHVLVRGGLERARRVRLEARHEHQHG
mmetsp:Transcript_35681/g.90203  ORF Transcript_35681/g.90203 Transcript_35681/m.90203 type:complete len:317 (+) Transcript_35681:583-1533(+)